MPELTTTATTYFLLKYNAYLTCDVGVSGFTIMDAAEWEHYQNIVKKATSSASYYIGANEEIRYIPGNKVLQDIEVTIISSDQVDTLRALFLELLDPTNKAFGFFPPAICFTQ